MTELTTRSQPAITSRVTNSRRVRPGTVLAIVLTGQLMAVIDNSIVNVATPAIHASLHAGGASLQLSRVRRRRVVSSASLPWKWRWAASAEAAGVSRMKLKPVGFGMAYSGKG